MLRSRRLALVAVAAVLGLSAAACGDARTSGGTLVAPPVIHVASGGSGPNATPEASTVDRMMMPYGDISYVFDGTLPDLGASAAAWRFPAGATPDATRVIAIAKVLGVEGQLRELPADQGGGWLVGPADYSGPTLQVGADGMLNWWFNQGATVASTGVACAEPASGGGTAPDVAPPDTATSSTDVPSCTTPEPPANVPDEATARQLATDLLGKLGYDASAFELEAYADEWGANVTAYQLLGGVRSPISVSLGFGADGAVTWASGVLASPQPVGEYPLVTTQTGLDRLNDDSGKWQYFGGPGIMARAGVAADTAIAAGEPSPAAPEPMPVDTLPIDGPMEPIVVHFTGARLGLTMLWDTDGTVWMLPAFLFATQDGGEYAVVAVDAQFLDLPTPDTVPVDTTPSATIPVDTRPVVTEPVAVPPIDTVVVSVEPMPPATGVAVSNG